MNEEEFYNIINFQEPRMKKIVTTINWGTNTRGQGKRSGGMIKGGMGNPPKGVKQYISYVPNYKEWKECENRGNANGYLYSQAREFGLSHKESMKYAILQHRYYKKSKFNKDAECFT